MTLLTGRPPYTDLEVERLSKGLISRKAFGAWLNSDIFNYAFEPALKKEFGGTTKWLGVVEAGAIYAIGFAPGDSIFVVGNNPRIEKIDALLDAASTQKVLGRYMELLMLDGKEYMPPAELEDTVAAFEKARVDALPKLRRLFAKAEDKAKKKPF